MSNTMAEAFCKEHLITWMENGEEHTSWEDGDIHTTMRGITQAGGITLFQGRAITLFQGMQKNGYYMTVTVFRDRSWMIHEEPASGQPIMIGTGEDEHRILNFIHQTLEDAEDEEEPEPEHEPPEFPAYLDAPREQWRHNQPTRKNQGHPGGGHHEL